MCMYVCACVRVCACMRMRVRVSQDILHSYMIAVLLNDFEDLESTGFIILKLQSYMMFLQKRSFSWLQAS